MTSFHGLQRDVKEPTSADGVSSETMIQLGHIASAYKSAVLIYLHVILDTVNTSTSDELMLQCLGMRTLLGSSKPEAVSACFQDIMRVPEDETCVVGLVPLLFIVASESENDGEFAAASQRLRGILGTACLGNIGPALELLDMTRQDRAEWRGTLKDFGWDLIVT